MKPTSSSELLCEFKNVTLKLPTSSTTTASLRDGFINSLSLHRTANKKIWKTALDQLNFTIRSGDRVGLLGKNGAGKTSVCRLICNKYRPTDGQVNLYVKVRALLDSHIGLEPELSGRENANLLAHLIFSDKKDLSKIVDEAIEFSELGDDSNAPFRTYSSGMKARLGLSLISSYPSELLVLDEVFQGADEFFAQKVRVRFLEIMEKSKGVLFISHNLEHVKKVCNRVIVLSKGKIVFDGDVDSGIELYHRNSTA